LRQPELEFYTVPIALKHILDPTRNVPLHPISSHIGSGFADLLAYGLTQEVLAVMMELVTITGLAESFSQDSLLKPDLFTLGQRRDKAQHRLLSLPIHEGLSDTFRACEINKCCRLTALVFATGLLFPVPRWTGVPQTLVKEVKTCLEQTSFEFLSSEGARPFFIWVTLLTGIAADGLPERLWLEESLTELLTLGGVYRWSEVKDIVESFLWMGSGCDSGAIGLWDNITAALHEKVDSSTLGLEVDVDRYLGPALN
jgi:hypothetical protein